MKTLACLLSGCLCLLSANRARAGDFTLFDDYGCPPAPPAVQADGGWYAPNARWARIDCGLAGAQAEVDSWRPGKDKAPPPAPAEGFKLQASHVILSTVSALLTIYLADLKIRVDRQCRAVMNPFAGC